MPPPSLGRIAHRYHWVDPSREVTHHRREQTLKHQHLIVQRRCSPHHFVVLSYGTKNFLQY